MSGEFNEPQNSRNQRSNDAGSKTRPAVAAGKRPLTMSLPAPAGAAPVQRRRDPAADSAPVQRTAKTSRWMDVAMRPDLHPAPVQRAASGGQAAEQDLPASGAGKAMPTEVQAKMEGAFDADFSAVRIHEGPRSEALGALAYTQGSDVHFAPGQYQPSSHSGQALLGHELAHVVQQSQGRVSATTQAKGVEVNDDAALEAEADAMGEKAARGEAVGGSGALSGTAGAKASATAQRSAPIQRVSAMDATTLIHDEYGAWMNWYNTVCVPAMHTIAQRNGQTFDQYLAALDEAQFRQEVEALHTGDKDETAWTKNISFNTLLDSDEYPGMKRVKNTNILVDPRIASDDQDLQTFIALYKSGAMVWYRGMSVSHFAYPMLRDMGVLGSEGTADSPTFTMGNANPTRWLPGLYDRVLAEGVAATVGGGEGGIREIIGRKDVPIGVTVQYAIQSPTPVAYLNDGEQVVRGPITGATIYRVVLLGPAGFTYRLANGNLGDLPPAAPYGAAAHSPAINDWEQGIDAWLLAHP